MGQFKLHGGFNNGWLGFVKDYGGWKVNYNGKANPDNVFRGNWEIPGNCGGDFEISVRIPRWTGHYEQGGNHHMEMDLSITANGVYGNGYDDVGFWVARGYCNGNEVGFRKQYVGQHFVDYKGTYHGHSGDARVEGHYTV